MSSSKAELLPGGGSIGNAEFPLSGGSIGKAEIPPKGGFASTTAVKRKKMVDPE